MRSTDGQGIMPKASGTKSHQLLCPSCSLCTHSLHPLQCPHTHTHQSSSSKAWQETSKGYLRRQTLAGCWRTWISYTAAGLRGFPLLLEAPNRMGRQSSGLVSLAVEQTLPWCRESPVPLGSRLSVLYCRLFSVPPHKIDKLVYFSWKLFESLGTNICRLKRFLNLHLQCFPVLDQVKSNALIFFFFCKQLSFSFQCKF